VLKQWSKTGAEKYFPGKHLYATDGNSRSNGYGKQMDEHLTKKTERVTGCAAAPQLGR